MYIMNIPIENNYENYEKYKDAVDRFFYRKFGFREWCCSTLEKRIEIVEKLGVSPPCDKQPQPVCVMYEDEDDRCRTYKRYEKGGLK